MEQEEEKLVKTEAEPIELNDDGSPKAKELQPEWTNPPKISELKSDVTEAEPDYNDHISKIRKWLSARDGDLKVKIPKGNSTVTHKLVRKQNEWRYSSLSEPLLSSEDMYDVEPVTSDDVDAARDNALILNKQFREDIDRVGFIDEYVRTAVDEGTVFVRVGWDFEEEEVTRLVPRKQLILPPQVRQQLEMAKQQVQAGQMHPQQFDQMMQQARQQAFEVDTDEFDEETSVEVVLNVPTLEVCDYNRVMIDPTSRGKLEEAKFIVYQFYSSKAELREDPKYTNVDSITTSGEDDAFGLSDEEIVNGTFEFKDEPRKKLLVTEYWGDWDIDDDGTTVPIVATYVGNIMIRLEENPFPDRKPPFVKVVYLPKRRDVYGGEPDAVLIEDHQDVIGAVTRGMIDLMAKSANSQQGVAADALDPAQRLRFEQGKDYIFNPGVDPTKAFFMSAYPEIPQSAMTMIEFHETQAQALTGQRDFGTAAGGSSLGTSATAVRSAMDATAKRELGILRRLSTGMIDIGKKIIAMNSVNLSDQEVIRHTDGEFSTIDRDSLDGKFDLNLSISTPEVDAEQAQDLGFMLQTIGPNMDPGLQGQILGKIARLKKMPGLAEKVENYQPQPDPMEEKIKELQVALLEAQVRNENAKATENIADAQNKTADVGLTEAKTQTELAKTRALDSGSDLSDLEFLNKKDGTDHLREMEKMDKSFDHEIGKKGADSLLSTSTPFSGNNFPKSSGSQIPKFAIGGDSLRGMDTPFENLDDVLQP